MRSVKRSLMALVFVSLGLGLLIGVLGSARLAAESLTADATSQSLILSGQKPRLQDFFPGGSATFTVSITNTGSVELQAVSVSGATTPDCNRSNLGSLAAGQSISYTCTRGGPGGVTQSFLNVLQANGTAGGFTVSHQSNAYVKVLNPDLRITKSPQSQTVRKGEKAFFSITLFNTSDFVMTIDEVDDVFNDNCDRNPSTTITLLEGESLNYPCSTSNIQEAMASVITVTTRNPANNDQYSASDIAWVELLALNATITPSQATIPEPGDQVTFSVVLANTGSKPLALSGLSTDKFGNLLDPNNSFVEAATNTCLPKPTLPTLPPFGGIFTCSFIATVIGQPSEFVNVLTAKAQDPNDVEITTTASAKVTITNVPASMTLTLGADPSFINPPSRVVNFSIQIKNTSESDAITITEIKDSLLGDLNGEGTCSVPVEGLLPGFSYQCQFSAIVSGQVGDQKSRTISVKAVDDDPVPGIITANEIVTVSVIQQPQQKVFMPNVADDNDFIIEPNNSCTNAHVMLVNRQYFVKPPAKYPSDQDYFAFDVVQSSQVIVELTNFIPQKGQLVIRKDEGCITVVARNPNATINKTLNLGQLAGGRYYIQIINDGPSNVEEHYGLIVRVN